MRRPFALAVGALSAPLFLLTGARAESHSPPALEFNFRCAELGPLKTAEVEARSRVEARLTDLGALSAQFSCDGDQLHVELEAVDEAARHATRGTLAGRPLEVALVDLFVQALQAFAEPSQQTEDQGELAAQVALSPGSTREKPSATDTRSTADSKNSRQESDDEDSASESTTADAPAPHVPARGAFARLNWDTFVSYESLGAQAVGTMGGGTTVLVGLSPLFRVGGTARIGFGVGTPDLSLTAWNLGLLGEFSPLGWLSVGAGPMASIHVANTTEPTRASGAHALWGGQAHADVLFGSKRAALQAGLALQVLASERVVRVEGVELMHIPPVSVEAHFGGRFGFFLER